MPEYEDISIYGHAASMLRARPGHAPVFVYILRLHSFFTKASNLQGPVASAGIAKRIESAALLAAPCGVTDHV